MKGYLYLKSSKSGNWSKKHVQIFSDKIRGKFLIACKKEPQDFKTLAEIIPHASKIIALAKFDVEAARDSTDGGVIKLTDASGTFELRDKSRERVDKWVNAIQEAKGETSSNSHSKKKLVTEDFHEDPIDDKENSPVNCKKQKNSSEGKVVLGKSRPILGQHSTSQLQQPQKVVVFQNEADASAACEAVVPDSKLQCKGEIAMLKKSSITTRKPVYP